MKSVKRVRSARSVTVGVGSTTSIVPRIVSASSPSTKAQPGNEIWTESGTRSPSEFVTGCGLMVGEHVAGSAPNAPAAATTGPSPNEPPPDSVRPSSSLCASAVVASPRDWAWAALSAGFWGVGAVVSVWHAATIASAPAARPAAMR